MTRIAMLRISSPDPDRPAFTAAYTRLAEFAEDAGTDGLDVWASNYTDQEGEPDHPERDALLALADKWRDTADGILNSGDPDPEDAAAAHNIRSCGDQLVRLVATLNL